MQNRIYELSDPRDENFAQADFYLASSEGYDLEEPRRCWRVKRLMSDHRDDLLLIRIDPPILGQPFGLGACDIDHVVVAATRHVGASLFPPSEWPLYVHVLRLLNDDAAGRDRLREGEYESIAWAELYSSEEAARQVGVYHKR